MSNCPRRTYGRGKGWRPPAMGYAMAHRRLLAVDFQREQLAPEEENQMPNDVRDAEVS